MQLINGMGTVSVYVLLSCVLTVCLDIVNVLGCVRVWGLFCVCLCSTVHGTAPPLSGFRPVHGVLCWALSSCYGVHLLL